MAARTTLANAGARDIEGVIVEYSPGLVIVATLGGSGTGKSALVNALLGEERGQAISPAASAAARGIRFTNHTDFVVTPIDSLFTVWSAVNRISKTGKVIGASERIPVSRALQALTADAAFQYRLEKDRGTLEAGKVADLVLLSRNPLTTDPGKLREVVVLETVKDGKTVYRRPAAK